MIGQNRIQSKTFFSFWIGQEMGPIEMASIFSFVKAGYSFELYTFDKLKYVPEGVTLLNAETYLSKSQYLKVLNKRNYISDVADYFRCLVMCKTGKIWVDLDVILLDKDFPFTETILGYESFCQANNAVFRFPKNSPILSWMISEIEKNDFEVFEEGWGNGGPQLITRAATKFDLVKQVAKPSVFYPIHHSKITHLLLPDKRNRIEEKLKHAKTLHLFSQILQPKICCYTHFLSRESWLSFKLSQLINEEMMKVILQNEMCRAGVLEPSNRVSPSLKSQMLRILRGIFNKTRRILRFIIALTKTRIRNFMEN